MTNTTIAAAFAAHIGSSESAVGNGNKAAAMAKAPTDEDAHNRVKLYATNNWGHWSLRGIGHVACVQSQNQSDEWWIVVRFESNDMTVLESRILPDTIYSHNPQGTSIVWSTSGLMSIVWSDVGKLKLSFFEKAGYTEILDKICQIQLEAKLRNSEAQCQQISENNRQLTAELHTSEGKNRETLEKNRELEQELSNAQAKIRGLEAKFEKTDVSLMISVLKENVGKLENGEISRLQKENEKMSNDNAMKEQELIDIQKKLVESEKRIADMNKEKEEMEEKKMAEELKSWEHLRQLLDGATEYAKGIRKQKEQSLKQQSRFASKQQSQEEEVTELGPDCESANGSSIDTQKNLEKAGAKNAENVA